MSGFARRRFKNRRKLDFLLRDMILGSRSILYVENTDPTIITSEDVDSFAKSLLNGDFDIKYRPCWKCDKDFYPNYDMDKCDECFFAQFPKEEVKEFYKSFF